MASEIAIPVIDVSPLLATRGDDNQVADEIGKACRNGGFFYITGHAVDHLLIERLKQLSRQFFAQDLDDKLKIGMRHGGRAWRGYFPVGDELTSGRPDQKEGIYFGAEHSDEDPKVKAGIPLHGRNLFPNIPGFRATVLDYLDAMTRLGHTLMRGIAVSLGLEATFFRKHYAGNPTILFRIFHYPPLPSGSADNRWSVGEHTDYGILTILNQDNTGGLQIKSQDRWIEAPPIADSLVCNIGDMLDRMTGGVYRSTLHRVHNGTASGRLSFPFFFDPNWDAQIQPIFPENAIDDDQIQRWDGTSLRELKGTYGEYLLRKVSKVFPHLSDENL